MHDLIAAARRLRRRPGIPRLWLLSDPVRLPDPRAACDRLPVGSGVIARDVALALLPALAKLLARQRVRLLVAGDGRLALHHRAGLHVPDRRPTAGLLPFLRQRRGRLLTVAAHGRVGLARARRLRADAVLLSPVFATGSHPGAPALGVLRWAALARRAGRPVVALGGVGRGNAMRLPPIAAGFAAIGAWLPQAVAPPP